MFLITLKKITHYYNNGFEEDIYIYIYIYIYKSTTRHLKFNYISIFKNLLRTDKETKSLKTI